MTEVDVPRYHGRRRASLPAMSLNQSLLTQVGSPSISRRTTHKFSPRLPSESKESTPRERSGSLSEREKKVCSHSKHIVKHKSPTRHNRDLSPVNLKKTAFKPKGRSPAGSSDDTSPREDPVAAAGARYNRGRRHSVDVLLTPHDKRVLAPKDSDARRAWAEICRVSDPHNFDATEYRKENLPYGSSLFQSVLHEMNEDSDEGGTREAKKATPVQKKKSSRAPTSSSSSAEADGRPSCLTQKKRHVRFGGGFCAYD